MTPIAVNLVGCGKGWQHPHARALALSPSFQVEAVVDPDHERRKEASLIFPGSMVVPEIGDVPEKGPRAWMVAVPPAALSRVALACAERKATALYLEKPGGTSVHELEEIRSSVSCPVMLGYQRRFDPRLQQALQWLRRGRCGGLKQLRVDCSFPDLVEDGWRNGPQGDWLDLVPHCVDLAQYITGRNPVDVVSCRGHVHKALFTMLMEDGLEVVVSSSRGEMLRFAVELIGRYGSCYVPLGREGLPCYQGSGSPHGLEKVREWIGHRLAPVDYEMRACAVAFQTFADLIRGNPGPACPDLGSAIKNREIVEKAMRQAGVDF